MTDHPDDAARLRELSREIRIIAIVAGQCSVEGPEDSQSLMAAAEAERCSRWADTIDSLTARETDGIEGLIANLAAMAEYFTTRDRWPSYAQTCLDARYLLVSRAPEAPEGIEGLIQRWSRKRQRVTPEPVTPYPKTYQEGRNEARFQCARELAALVSRATRAHDDSTRQSSPCPDTPAGSPRSSQRRRLRAPVYDGTEPCHADGATPTNRKTGLCRHCDNGGD